MRLALPLPWGRQVLLTSEPLHVPADAEEEEMAACREELQRRLDDLRQRSLDYFGGNEKAADPLGPPVGAFPTPPADKSASRS
jgi:hypothetical protein